MKRKFSILLLGASILLASFVTINDVLDDVGATIEEMKEITVYQVARKNLDVPYYTSSMRQACKKLPIGVREATMLNLGKVMKDYVSSSEFAMDYKAYVEKNFAGDLKRPEVKSFGEREKKIEDLLKTFENPDIFPIYVQQFEQEIQMAKMYIEMMDQTPEIKLPKTKAEYKKDIDELTKLKKLHSTDLPAFKKQLAAHLADSELQSRDEYRKAEEQRKQKAYEELLDYKTLIKKQLKEFLDISATVDFNAKTAMKNGRMEFVNETYQAKPDSWKFCYRAGKEAVAGARKFVQGWLAELK